MGLFARPQVMRHSRAVLQIPPKPPVPHGLPLYKNRYSLTRSESTLPQVLIPLHFISFISNTYKKPVGGTPSSSPKVWQLVTSSPKFIIPGDARNLPCATNAKFVIPSAARNLLFLTSIVTSLRLCVTLDFLFPSGTPKPDMLSSVGTGFRAPTKPVIPSEARNLSSRATGKIATRGHPCKEQRKNGRAPRTCRTDTPGRRAGTRRSDFLDLRRRQSSRRVRRQPLPLFLQHFPGARRHAPSKRPAPPWLESRHVQIPALAQ